MKINRITHQEIALIFGYNIDYAKARLTLIRTTLGKPPGSMLTVTEFCRYEHISLEDFDVMLERARPSKASQSQIDFRR